MNFTKNLSDPPNCLHQPPPASTNRSNEASVNNDDGPEVFCQVTLDVLYKNDHYDNKHWRGNLMRFINKQLSKKIMVMLRLLTYDTFLKIL